MGTQCRDCVSRVSRHTRQSVACLCCVSRVCVACRNVHIYVRAIYVHRYADCVASVAEKCRREGIESVECVLSVARVSRHTRHSVECVCRVSQESQRVYREGRVCVSRVWSVSRHLCVESLCRVSQQSRGDSVSIVSGLCFNSLETQVSPESHVCPETHTLFTVRLHTP